jgi:hypothetical protein
MEHSVSLSNGEDKGAGFASAPFADWRGSKNGLAAETAGISSTQAPARILIEPPIDDSAIRQFCVTGEQGRQRLAAWAEQAWRAANHSGEIQDDVRPLRRRHVREMLDRVTADLRASDVIEIALSPDQSGKSRDRHLQLMLWLSYGCIGLGFFVLNWTLSSYLLGSGLLDYADHPWKTYAFSSLPITAAFTLKATAALFSEPKRPYAGGLKSAPLCGSASMRG